METLNTAGALEPRVIPNWRNILIAVLVVVILGNAALIIHVSGQVKKAEQESATLHREVAAAREELAKLARTNSALRAKLDDAFRSIRKYRKYVSRAKATMSGAAVRVVTRVPNTGKMVAITIDDGWNSEWVKKALDILKEKKVRATLFPVGKSLASDGGIWKRAVKEGHEIGNHTFSHTKLALLREAEILKEVDASQKALDKLLGRHYAVKFFRPPGMSGFLDYAGTALIRDAMARRGLIVALWDNETAYQVYRTKGLDVAPAEVAHAATRSAKSGSIILLHFMKPDVEALPLIIDRLKAKGLRPVTLSAMMELDF